MARLQVSSTVSTIARLNPSCLVYTTPQAHRNPDSPAPIKLYSHIEPRSDLRRAHHTTSRPQASRGYTSAYQYNMSSRFGRDAARDDLFSSYNRSASPSKSKNKARASPYNAGGYGLPSEGPGFAAYPSASTNGNLYGGYGGGSGYGAGAGKKSDDGYGGGNGGGAGGGYRSATPNSRGQYNSATLDELESQNEEQTGVLIGKVKMLKDVCAASVASSFVALCFGLR